VSNKKHPILKQWLTTGSVAFVASCGCSLPFTQNLFQSALIGLATIPGVAASRIFSFRQRHQQLNRQLERGKLRLNELQHRGEMLNKQLQIRQKDCQAIEIKVAQLHSLAANLNGQINLDRQQHQDLEQQLAALTLYAQEQQSFATKIDRQIQEKQARSLEVATKINSLKVETAQLQAAKLHLVSEIDRSKISQIDIQNTIAQSVATKQELVLEIQQLQDRQDLDRDSFNRSISQQQQLIHELDAIIVDRQQTQQHLTAELDRLAPIVATISTELVERDRKLVLVQQQLSETELALTVKQSKSDELAAEILVRNDEIESSSDYLSQKLQQRELKIAQLELSSRQAELDNLDLKIQAKRQEIDDIDLEDILQIFEPKPPSISRDLDSIDLPGAWHEKFIDNPHLPVLQHIEKHGTITEAEASSKLGNTRSVRQFANKLEEYTPDLPFSIRVESSPKGNRYIKENQN
jgi:hypothetical protein